MEIWLNPKPGEIREFFYSKSDWTKVTSCMISVAGDNKKAISTIVVGSWLSATEYLQDKSIFS